ncbi:MBL fold metallo-hydrolase [Desulfoluna butyratoxydans]|uniref:Metallo-beta-lactamase n=1 Tax=Desulfoluna butyratoxydans TaxID=231438 RepID=A0A4U8YJE5_9BACT|nr:MBL fold metallo-hydrolase [Desulfoluna butyratoxydans]VFQ43507.1 metallo-beta-lactamase [Desulfoluna butyratoxydans]
MEFGGYRCHGVEMCDFLLDGGAMFGVVPKPLWEKKIASDDKNRIPLKARSLLLRGNGRNILVDTGCGTKFSDKELAIYGVTSTRSPDQALSDFGLSTAEITDVILTHLHFDHAGGTTFLKDGKAVPTFPNATYYTQKRQLNWAKHPTLRDRASFFAENWAPMEESGQLTVLDGNTLPIDGIDLLFSDGHTCGQQLPLIHGEEGALLYCGDLIPTSAHIPVPWHMGYDNQPLLIMSEKENVLKQAVAGNWTLFFEHDPAIAAATVKEGRKGIERDRVVEIL